MLCCKPRRKSNGSDSDGEQDPEPPIPPPAPPGQTVAATAKDMKATGDTTATAAAVAEWTSDPNVATIADTILARADLDSVAGN